MLMLATRSRTIVVSDDNSSFFSSLESRRVQARAPAPDAELSIKWEVVEAFLTAAREGDFEALVAVLDPDVMLRADGGLAGPSAQVRGAEAVARRALM
jgi:hypothetical protein